MTKEILLNDQYGVMSKISAKIIADSEANGRRLVTMLLTFPRFILPELNTHRVFSKNSASSRAIPAFKMAKKVDEDPFVPIVWQKNHKGMQGFEYFEDPKQIKFREETWLKAKNYAVGMAKYLNSSQDVTKQITNRLLEPFMWHTVLLSGTEFTNFFKLRAPKYKMELPGQYDDGKEPTVIINSRKTAEKYGADKYKNYTDLDWLKISESEAEPHMQLLAEKMYDEMHRSEPVQLGPHDLHLPFIRDNEWDLFSDDELIMISVARCARLSYMTFDKEIDYEKDFELYHKLLDSKHMSPFEHIGFAMDKSEYLKYNKTEYNGFEYGVSGNFRGFIQYRKMIE